MKTRDYKFRVWVGATKKMLDWDFWKHNAITTEEFFGANSHIMQWTGFVDKQGVDIYDGDIVRATFDSKMIPINLPVRWYICGWEPFNGYSDIFMNGYKPSDHLVIGNIYQNPEIEYAKTPNDLQTTEKCTGCGIQWKEQGKQCPVCYSWSEHDREMLKEGLQRSDRDTRRGI